MLIRIPLGKLREESPDFGVISMEDVSAVSYFQAKYQGIPLEGYTRMFEKMVDHPNIEVRLNNEFDKSMLMKTITFSSPARSTNSSTTNLVSCRTEACDLIS